MDFRRFFHLYIKQGYDCFFVCLYSSLYHLFLFSFSFSNLFNLAPFAESHTFKIFQLSFIHSFNFIDDKTHVKEISI